MHLGETATLFLPLRKYTLQVILQRHRKSSEEFAGRRQQEAAKVLKSTAATHDGVLGTYVFPEKTQQEAGNRCE
jgi:hypothetical protein